MFDAPAVEAGEPVARPRVDKTFRFYDPHQVFLLPPSIDDWLPEGHTARLVSEVVEEVLDLEPFLAAHTEARGFPPYDPRLMLKLLIYGYTTGVRSSRAIERRCHDDVAFRFLAANAAPDHRTIARFRRRHLDALKGLFIEVLKLCQAAGMVRLGRVALDGSKVRANASRRKAMSYKRMTEREASLAAEVEEMMADAEATDVAEDKRFGPDGRGDDLAGELARRTSRLAKIRQAKADLEADAARQAGADAARRSWHHSARRGEDPDARQDAAAEAATEAAARATPDDKAQRNFTDPDSRIMKTSDGSFHYCYNAQAVVDDAHQVIIATRLDNRAADAPAFAGMVDAAIANCGAAPRQVLADAGYFSEDNVHAATQRKVDALIATGRLPHNKTPPPAPRGRIPKTATIKERMARKLRTKAGRAAYARRKAIVEPVFGQTEVCQGGKRLLLRGAQATEAEWTFLNACHNLRKLLSFAGTTKPTPA
ncbi:MAG TPA: IS1182 family transposase [Acidimicrobiales bacterium]|nr:IS1182 family transposase [Acidimicrobiales bacterium]